MPLIHLLLRQITVAEKPYSQTILLFTTRQDRVLMRALDGSAIPKRMPLLTLSLVVMAKLRNS